MKIKELYEASLGIVSAVLCGVCHCNVALIAVYAAAMNFSIFEVSFVTFLVAISGAISQWPIGKLSIFMIEDPCLFNFCSIFCTMCYFFSWNNAFA